MKAHSPGTDMAMLCRAGPQLDDSSAHTVTLRCAGRARGGGSLTRRALLWAAGCCLRGVALEVDGLACVLGQAGEPGPAAGGAAGDLADLGGRDALVLEVRRIALLPCRGEVYSCTAPG